MIETIIIALIFSKIKGYNIKPFLKSFTIVPVVIMEGISLYTQINIFMGNYSGIQYAGIIKTLSICSYLFIVFKYGLYINSIIGSSLVFIGGLLNDIAIKANGGFMPVFPTLSYITGYATVESFNIVDDIHILGNASTKLVWLTDIIDLGYSVLSIGDVFIRGFLFIIIYSAVKKVNKDKCTEDKGE